MPCYTITTQTISAGLQNAMPDLLMKAMEDLRYRKPWNDAYTWYRDGRLSSVNWSKEDGLVITAEDPDLVKAQILQSYSKQAVSWAAQRAGMKVSITGQNTMKIKR
jgi:hypothetical protein